MKNTLQKIVHSPYIFAFAILVLEGSVNVVLTLVSGRELGEANMRSFVWFIFAAYLAALVFKEPVSSSYGIRLVGTYCTIIMIITLLGVFGNNTFHSSGVLLMFLYLGIVSVIQYMIFMSLSKIFVKQINKSKD